MLKTTSEAAHLQPNPLRIRYHLRSRVPKTIDSTHYRRHGTRLFQGQQGGQTAAGLAVLPVFVERVGVGPPSSSLSAANRVFSVGRSFLCTPRYQTATDTQTELYFLVLRWAIKSFENVTSLRIKSQRKYSTGSPDQATRTATVEIEAKISVNQDRKCLETFQQSKELR